MNMKMFDTYVNEYRTIHNKEDTLKMLSIHENYLNYCKFNYSVKTLKEYEAKIKHIQELKRRCKNDVDIL